jgi:hypothetical protein
MLDRRTQMFTVAESSGDGFNRGHCVASISAIRRGYPHEWTSVDSELMFLGAVKRPAIAVPVSPLQAEV